MGARERERERKFVSFCSPCLVSMSVLLTSLNTDTLLYVLKQHVKCLEGFLLCRVLDGRDTYIYFKTIQAHSWSVIVTISFFFIFFTSDQFVPAAGGLLVK